MSRFSYALFLAGLLLVVTGCATARMNTAQGLHTAMNSVTDAVDPAYSLAVAACDSREGLIVARSGTTLSQDRDDLRSVRAQCDDVFDAFETVRQAQQVARQAANALESDSSKDAFGAAIAALTAVRDAWLTVKGMISGGWFAELIRGDEDE